MEKQNSSFRGIHGNIENTNQIHYLIIIYITRNSNLHMKFDRGRTHNSNHVQEYTLAIIVPYN